MAKLSFPTSKNIPPPLLVDVTQLEQLEQVIDKHIDRLRKEREKQISAAIEEDISQDLARGFLKRDDVDSQRERLRKLIPQRSTWVEQKRSITVLLSRGREVEVESFAEAVSHPQSQDEVPLGFSLHLNIPPIKVRVDLNGTWGRDLLVSVEPNDLETSQAIFGALVNWANDIEAPRWQQKWSQFSGLFLFLLWMWVVTGVASIPLINWGSTAKETNRAEARKLLAQGIGPSNEHRAIQLLLAIEADYSPAGAQKPSLGIRYWSYVCLGAILLLVASICPKQVLGLWKGKRQLKFWRLWVRTVTITIPTVAITSVMLPWLLYWLHFTPRNP